MFEGLIGMTGSRTKCNEIDQGNDKSTRRESNNPWTAANLRTRPEISVISEATI